MPLALAARTVAVCLAAAPAPDASAPDAAHRPPAKTPPPAVVIVPILGAVLLPVTLPTSTPRRRVPAQAAGAAAVGTDGSRGPATPPEGRTGP